MSSVADQLRAAREAQHLTISQAADATKIRTDHLRALEEGDYNTFIAPVYIRGFVRNYAKMLKMDAGPIMTQLEAELGKSEKFSDHPSLTHAPRGALDMGMLYLSRVNWKYALPILAVIILVFGSVYGYQAYYRYKNTDPLADLGPGLYQPKQETKSLLLPLTTNTTTRR